MSLQSSAKQSFLLLAQGSCNLDHFVVGIEGKAVDPVDPTCLLVQGKVLVVRLGVLIVGSVHDSPRYAPPNLFTIVNLKKLISLSRTIATPAGFRAS